MAKVYGRAASYTSVKARKLTEWGALALASITIVLGAVIGYGTAMLTRYPSLWMAGPFVLVAAAIAFYYFNRFFNRWYDGIIQERRSYLKGADGELYVGWLLEELPEAYHIFHGIQLKDCADLDHIVVGPTGIHYVSTKNYRGYFQLTAEGLVWNGEPKQQLTRQTLAQAMDLRDRLSALTQANPFVNAVLVLPWGYVKGANPVDHVWVLTKDDLMRYFERSPARLEPAEVKRFAETLELLSKTSSQITRGTTAPMKSR